MIKSLSIQNFQSHENTEINFDSGVNVIVGRSDSGKTAILRALRWIRWGRPTGDSFRSTWGGKTSCSVKTEEGEVCRIKDKTDSYLYYTGKKQFEFKALGSNIPEEIITFFNLDEINLQRQLDSPFLLSDTPGQVAQHFNKVANLDKIDSSTQQINSWIRELTSDIKHKQEQADKYEEELKQFEHLEQMEADIEVLEEMDKRLTNLLRNQTKLETFIDNIKEVDNNIEVESELLQYEEPINKIFTIRSEIAEKVIKAEQLAYLTQSIEKTKAEIGYYNNIATLENPINNLLRLYRDVKALKSDKMLLNKAISYVNSTKYKLAQAESLKMTLEAKFDEEFPDVCPLCGSKLK